MNIPRMDSNDRRQKDKHDRPLTNQRGCIINHADVIAQYNTYQSNKNAAPMLREERKMANAAASAERKLQAAATKKQTATKKKPEKKPSVHKENNIEVRTLPPRMKRKHDDMTYSYSDEEE